MPPSTRRALRIVTRDGVGLHVTDSGDGTPIVFLHEFCADHRSWSGQVDELREEYRCVTFAARGYPPSDVPLDESSYSWEHSAADVIAVLDGLGIEQAHIVGLSMGAYTAVQLGLHHSDRIRSIMAVSVGSGSDPDMREAYLAETSAVAHRLHADGPGVVGRRMAHGPSRIQLQRSNEPAWNQMIEQFSQLSAEGLAHTIIRVQGSRPPLQEFTPALTAMTVPLLVVVGDEDEACLPTGLMLKRTAASCGLSVLPNTGHSPNLEDPAGFDELVRSFVRAVESGAWPIRDPRSLPILQFTGVDSDAHDDDRRRTWTS